MGSETSEQVMALLKELAPLKELEKQHEANLNETEREAHVGDFLFSALNNSA